MKKGCPCGIPILIKMKKIILFILIISILTSLSACEGEPKKQKFNAYYFDWFDTATVITGYEETKEDFDKVMEDVELLFDKYHRLYNIYLKYDGVNNLATVNTKNGNEHSRVRVDAEIIELIEFSKEMNRITNGKFNIAMGSVLSIWHYHREVGLDNPAEASLPDMEKLLEASEHMNMDDILIDKEDSTIYLSDPKMSLDVGAVAKGYACEKVANHLEKLGVSGYVINAGGNIRAIGEKPDGSDWVIGIENPDTENEEKPYIAQLALRDKALVTSGSYQRFYTVNGKNYHHIIDPDTLMPSEKYLSVSVLCNDSGMGDALSTALFNMDLEDGKRLVESLPDVEALWVLPSGEISRSNSFHKYESTNN